MSLSKKTARYLALAGAIGVILAIASYLIIHYDVTWDQVKDMVRNAPGWIFFAALVLLPPLGLPLSLFLFAIGARFGIAVGVLLACLAVFTHHAIALYLSRFISRLFSLDRKQSKLWKTLEQKAQGNSSKLLFLWGLLPGLPYVVKLYLPLAMGVKATPYLCWNSAGHVLGTILFVGFGNAVFEGLSIEIIVIIAVGAVLSIGLKLYRNSLKQEAATNDAT